MSSVIAFLRNLFTANRIAALATWLAGLAAFIAGIVQVLPAHWQNYALIATGLLVKVVTTLKFLDGSQKWDALTFAAPDNAGLTSSLTEKPETAAKPDAPKLASGGLVHGPGTGSTSSEITESSPLASDAPNPQV